MQTRESISKPIQFEDNVSHPILAPKRQINSSDFCWRASIVMIQLDQWSVITGRRSHSAPVLNLVGPSTMAPAFKYRLVPTKDQSDKSLELPQAELPSPTDRLTKRRMTFRFIAISLLVFMSMACLLSKRMASGSARTGCRMTGPSRNIATAKLPTHYKLPSGDLIPSVGLGT